MNKRDKLAEQVIKAGRILANDGQADWIWGHVTARLPEAPDEILMKPANIGLDEITPENMITVNVEGEKTSGPLPRHVEVFIHTEILRARPDMNAVIHTHAPHAIVFSALGKPMQAVGHNGAMFCNHLPVFSETSDLIMTQALGKAVATTMGESNALLLRNHGVVTAGRTVEEAIFFAVHLEQACKMQILAESCGGARLLTSPEEAKIKAKRLNNVAAHHNVFEYLARCCKSPIGTPV
jgi:L-ribulose-5-phosphate 4-epimerase